MLQSFALLARVTVVSFLFVISACSAAWAADGPYVCAGVPDLRVLLPASPAEGSRERELELARMHEIEAHRTPEQAAQAKADDAEESMFFFRTIFGAKFTRENVPKTAILSDRVRRMKSRSMTP
jgi:acid phosphatase (class A)